jgi:pre-mRNA-splicing helicase BRR2
MPIESQFISQLADQLNSEIVLGSIMSTRDAVTWLGYTYLYVRMMRSPHTYSISDDELTNDPLLVKRRADLVHSAATLLDKHNLIKYDKKTGVFQSTALGKIASHYYIKYPSIAIYNEHIKPNMGIIELFKVFSLSNEFKYIPIREEEKLELLKLMESVPLPIKGSAEDPTTKINVLLQAYISRSKLDGLALNSDMVYVTQSAGRLMRGLFEIFLRRGWAHIAKIALNVCKMIDKRMWSCMTPLRQFKVHPPIPEEILRRIEKKEQFTWDHFYSMNPQQIGDLIKFPKFGKALHKYIHQFPRIELTAFVQPITRSCLKIDLTVTPDFHWDEKIHGKAEPFWIIVEDCDGELILYCEQFVLKQKYLKEKEYTFEFTVPLFEPLHPIYYIRVISDRWIQAEAQLPVSFKNLILPEKFPAPTELLDLVLMPVHSLKWVEAEKLFEGLGIKTFNSIQTQVFGSFFNSDENIFLGASTGSGKTICILFSILRAFKNYKEGEKIVYVAPLEPIARFRYKQFSKLFKSFKKSVGILTGQVTVDMQILEKSNIIIAQPEHWDVVSRRWKQRKVLHQVRLFIVDELHLLEKRSAVLEVVVSRMRYISSHIERPCRIVGISTSLANYKDVAEWIGNA